jgi:endothelin-converting enzyme
MSQSTVKNVSLAEISDAAPAFSFDKLVAGLTPAGKTPSTILLDQPTFWPQYSALVANHSKTAVQGYMLWKTIAALGGSVEAPDLWTLLGRSPPGERWEQCVAAADAMLRHILDYYFVIATYPDLTLQAADKMTVNIQTQFKKRLGELDWMSADSKQRAIKKADNIIRNIGYPKAVPDLRSADSVASYYAGGINITGDHFSNTLSGRRLQTAKAFAEVASAPNRNEMDDIATVNAFYAPQANSITIPAGISQLTLFHYHLPDYALYGGLGAVIGHEITHGFDNNGRRWSEDAEYEAWWDNSTISAFEQRAQCFVEQYSAFEVDTPTGKQKVDGLNTLGENLADAGGLRSAYDAWAVQRAAMPSSWDQKLPGLESFTSEQLFFVLYANMWCETMTPDRMAVQLTNEHAPSMLRIRGGTQNSRAFREAFKCKVKEPVCELF